jgi:hypothetical protein
MEHAGLPTVSIVSSTFLKAAAVVSKGLGMPELKIAHYPGMPMTDSSEELRRKVREHLLPEVLAGLTGEAGYGENAVDAEPGARDIVFRGSLDEVNEYFHDQLWTDGMAIIPPTVERVERFLKYTDRDPMEVLGICPPDNREATIWSVAVNGVMAGCKPEYLPILIAVVECICDPRFRLQDAGSTPGWEPLIVLNGPLVKSLDFNSGSGVMRVGRRANTSIGRFLRMFIRNLAGCRILPGGADKGSIGQSFNVVLAENEDACAELKWKTFAQDQGFAEGENVVTVQSEVYISPPTYSAGATAMEHMRILYEVIGQATIAYWSPIGMGYAQWHPLIVLGPGVAKVFADDGWTKDDIRRYLYENVKLPAERIEAYAYHVGLTGFSLKGQVEKGYLPPEYTESDDPSRLLRCNYKAEWIGIVIAGDPGRNQSKCYVSNHIQGPPTSRKVVLPKRWKELTGGH